MDEYTPPTPDIEEPEEDVITFKRSHFYLALVPIAFILGLAVGYIIWGRTSTPVAQAPDTQANVEVAQPAQNQPAGEQSAAEATPELRRYDVPLDDDPIIGPADAPITIIEFSDYECPYCRRFHTETFPQLMETFGNQIRFVYRDFPLTSIHPNAVSAAIAANCAGEQGMYWEYNQLLFQQEFGLGESAYEKYATQLDLNMGAFKDCLASPAQQEEVLKDQTFATEFGIRSTPTFFINGIPVVGAQPYEVFRQIIEKELAGELP